MVSLSYLEELNGWRDIVEQILVENRYKQSDFNLFVS